ncbi:hypothetical protein R0J93_22075, partial [Pseudoalteromonas sp. SIMBA_148]
LELSGLAPIEAHRPFAEVIEDSELELFTPYSLNHQGAPLLTCEQRLSSGRVLEVRSHPMPTESGLRPSTGSSVMSSLPIHSAGQLSAFGKSQVRLGSR